MFSGCRCRCSVTISCAHDSPTRDASLIPTNATKFAVTACTAAGTAAVLPEGDDADGGRDRRAGPTSGQVLRESPETDPAADQRRKRRLAGRRGRRRGGGRQLRRRPALQPPETGAAFLRAAHGVRPDGSGAAGDVRLGSPEEFCDDPLPVAVVER